MAMTQRERSVFASQILAAMSRAEKEGLLSLLSLEEVLALLPVITPSDKVVMLLALSPEERAAPLRFLIMPAKKPVSQPLGSFVRVRSERIF